MATNNMLDNYQDWKDCLDAEDGARKKILVDVLVDFWRLVKDEQGYVIGRLVGEFKNGEADING